MKAILVIDMPTNCGDCSMCQIFGTRTDFRCVVLDKDVEEDNEEYYILRPSWCPLKPLPKKSIDMPNDEEYMKHYKQGRNDVIAEIKGEMVQNFCDEEIEKC